MQQTIPSYKAASLPTDQRVEDLLGRMQLNEKIAQLYEIWDLPHNRDQAREYIRQNGVGSRILAGSHLTGSDRGDAQSAREINSWQRIAVEESRLGIPILFGRDVIHGFRTIFPIPLGLAATFDPELVEKVYTTAAREAASAGVNWAFAPMLDIARDPRWGRISEGSGEDPYLTSRMAEAAVWGFQGRLKDNWISSNRIMACAKHYIGYGAAEGGRDYNTSEISDNTLRNIYLRPFQAAVRAGVASVMSGFHDLNGESVSGSPYLLNQVLRGELGFDGLVISDWASVWELINHRVAADEADAARLALESGVDMEMVSTCYRDHLQELVEAGSLSLDVIDTAVRRVLKRKFEFGLFENPYVNEELAGEVLYSPDHLELARETAASSIVLLKNEDSILPLSPAAGSIAFMGPFLDETTNLWGSWSPDGVPSDMNSLWDAIQRRYSTNSLPHINPALADEMLLAALKADKVVFFAGEAASRSGENNNVTDIELPAGQTELIQRICGLGKQVVVVIFAGRPLNLSRVAASANAILYCWHPGSMGPDAVLDVLFGEKEPGGRLPVSLPRDNNQIPVHYNFHSTGKAFDSAGRPVDRSYRETERYQDQLTAPLYPFGYGLGYSQFEYTNISIEPAVTFAGQPVKVYVDVTNTGNRMGSEVVQCYLQDCVATRTRPARELKGFRKIHLQPGEKARICFTLGEDEMGFFGPGGIWMVEPGEFKVWIGSDCHAKLEAGFTFKK